MDYFLRDSPLEAYGFSHMKDCLLKHFLIVTEINGKLNVVTFRSVASTVLSDFYHQNKETDPDDEKLRLIKTAAQLIKDDIKSVVQDKSIYPSSLDMSDDEVLLATSQIH